MDELKTEQLAAARWGALSGIEDDNKDRGRLAISFYAGEQWDARDLKKRMTKRRPTMVVNYVKSTIDPVINSVCDNLPECQISPDADGQNAETVDFCEGAIRHIHYISSAKAVYAQAVRDLALAGEGYWRVDIEPGQNYGDQQIAIRPFESWEAVYVAPGIYKDRSDSEFAFVRTKMSRRKARKVFGRDYESVGSAPLSYDYDLMDPSEDSNVLVWEYWRKESIDETQYQIAGKWKTAEEITALGHRVDETMMLVKDKENTPIATIDSIGKRKKTAVIRSYMIDGLTKLFDQVNWPGTHIPIVMLAGEENNINGRLIRYGLVQPMMSVQQVINMDFSAAAESLQQLSSTPYIAAAEAVLPYREAWTNMASDSPSVLLYNHRDAAMQPIPPPIRVQSPVQQSMSSLGEMSARFMQSLVGANPELDAADAGGYATGQRNPTAIPGASWMVANTVRAGIALTGRIIVDIMTKLYAEGDTVRVRSRSGHARSVSVSGNPATKGALILGPEMYGIEARAAVDDETQNSRSFDLLAETIKSSPPLGQLVGDLLFTSAQLPMSGEISRRIRLKMDPILFEGPEKIGPLLNKANQENQQLKQMLAEKDKMISDLQFKSQSSMVESQTVLQGVKLKEENAAYRAETDRLKAVMPAVESGFISPEILKPIVQQLLNEMFSQQFSAHPSQEQQQ